MTADTDHQTADVIEPADPMLPTTPHLRLLQRKLALQPEEQDLSGEADDDDIADLGEDDIEDHDEASDEDDDTLAFEDDDAALDAALEAWEAEETEQGSDMEDAPMPQPGDR
ncbi:hypothetical protein [Agrobacterium vitis]|uniref:hypothetical protein n=1 Tax=Agrobacterium vitis TaxID=373 RepID=UPI003D2E65B9